VYAGSIPTPASNVVRSRCTRRCAAHVHLERVISGRALGRRGDPADFKGG
jgi:hypothetical protein